MALRKMNRIAEAVSAERLAECVTYDPQTGMFQWLERPEGHFDNRSKQRRWNGKYAGRPAFTSSCPRGYHRGCVDGRFLYAHRAAFALVEGEWPSLQVDHIDRCKSNNKLSNLRQVSHAENRRNTDNYVSAKLRENLAMECQRPSLPKGIRRQGKSTWGVRFKRDGVEKHIGSYRCFGAAVKARIQAL